MSSQSDKLSLWQLILITIATEFGFANVVIAYYQMSYASVFWYVIAALTFFLPMVLIVAEFGSAIKNDSGGLYSWLIHSLGEKWAFIGTFIWLCNFVINIIQIASNQGIDFSELIFGSDTTGTWHLGSIGSTGIFSIIAIAIILIATIASCRGVRNVALVSSIGGVMSLSIVAIFVIISFALIIINHGELAQPLHGISSWVKSPNPAFRTPSSVSSFIVYAIFSYGGIESVSGLIDKLKNPRKTFPKAIIYAAIIMATIYIGGILLCGYSVNWHRVFGGNGVNLANDTYLLMANLGIYLAHSLGWSVATGKLIGTCIVHFTAFSIVLNTIGVIVVLVYSPIKGLIAGSSNDLWPKRAVHFNKHDMPSCAMWTQFALIAVTLFFVALSGKSGQNFFTIIVDMNNISSIFPYYFLAVAFIAFKKRKDLDRPFVALHTKGATYLTVSVLLISMTFGVGASLITPILQQQYMTAFWSFIGPIFFCALGAVLYHFGIRRRAKRMIADNVQYERDHDVSKLK